MIVAERDLVEAIESTLFVLPAVTGLSQDLGIPGLRPPSPGRPESAPGIRRGLAACRAARAPGKPLGVTGVGSGRPNAGGGSRPAAGTTTCRTR